MAKDRIRIVKDEEAPESVELLAKSIVEVSRASKALLGAGLGERGLIVLLQDRIGPTNITKSQIKLVLDNLPRLGAWYTTIR